MDVGFSGFGDFDEEDQEFCLNDVREEMQNHVSIVEFCMETFDELHAEERKTERENQLLVGQLLQQRLAVSQAATS